MPRIELKKIDRLIAGDNLFGTEARLRRIRSANNRFITTRRRSRHVDDDDLSSTSSASVDGNPRYQSLFNGPEESSLNRRIESRDPIEAIKSQVKQNEPCDSSKTKIQKRRPKTAKNRYIGA